MRENEQQNQALSHVHSQGSSYEQVGQSRNYSNKKSDFTHRTLGFFEKHRQLISQIRNLIDVVIVLFSASVAFFIKYGSLNFSTADGFAVLLIILLMMIIFTQAGLYRHWRRRSIWLEIRTLALSWFIAILTLSLIAYATKTGALVSRAWIFSTFALAFILMTLARVTIKVVFHKLYTSGLFTANAVIYGAGDFGGKLTQWLNQAEWAGVKVIGFFDDNENKHHTIENGLPVFGGLEDLKTVFQRHQNPDSKLPLGNIEQVWIALPSHSIVRGKEIIKELENSPAQIHFVPDLSEFDLMSQSLDMIAGIPVVNLSASPIVGTDSLIKNIFDKLFSALALILLSPLMLLIALLIKLSSKGPILFKQRRYGLDGKDIEVWKFRTMTCCEDGDDVIQAKKNDIRVTAIGKYLRAWSLDELPQFFNVLQGTMSVVGPRPHAVAHNELYRNDISEYMRRHIVKPGITGWAQINGLRGETDTIEKMEQRVNLDLEYIRNWSFSFDLYIVVLTVFKGFFNKNAY